MTNGYKTSVGERGQKLSGGERQRVGIARCLLKDSKIVLFDEATSSLDIKTEFEVMKAINNLSKDFTVLIITHRLSTLKSCDKIFEIKKGIIKKILSHKKMVNKVKYDN
jgi:ABC-type multidrug transport system fused ATPase/permease subunit